MTNATPTTATATSASRPDPKLDALLALVARMSVAASETTLLVAEVNARSIEPAARPTPPTPSPPAFPDGSGETCSESNTQIRGIPNHLGQNKTSRAEALAFYRENYLAAVHYDALVGNGYDVAANNVPAGVQKWIASAPAAV
ncbi:hypothetical protein C8F04DRAFT_1203526 [Mycena alexandri]|uniref:Uncharacterized protein n=1 Tax=Mycena alexandri TaxID=1745969 RepID=A0AAD6WKW3_9AGAR|nr:hypothetical protein C8F04DRAFT_1203526 [Mycena alexandri]